SFSSRLALRVVTGRHTGNWASNANCGISLAVADHLAILHQDDRWCEGRLVAIREAVQAEPTAPLLFHPVYYVNDSGRRIGRWEAPFPRRRALLDASQIVGHLLVQNFIACCAATFRRDAWQRVGGLDETLW